MRTGSIRKNIFMKLAGIAAAFVMVIAMVTGGIVPAQAASGQGTITIIPPAGNEGNSNTYRLYRIFDATYSKNGGVRYTLLPGHVANDRTWSPMSRYFDVDSAGNVTAKDAARVGGSGSDKDQLNENALAGIEVYIQRSRLTPVATVTATGTSPVTATVDYGYYYIEGTMSSESGAFVTSNTPDATVYDKASVPVVTKVISKVDNRGSITNDGKKAIAQVGDTLTYIATVTFGKNASNIKFHDKMGSGLAKIDGSNIDVRILSSANAGATDITSRYTPTVSRGTDVDPGDDITVSFAEGTPEDAVATITYTAKVVKADMNTDDKAAENTAWVTFGASSDEKTPEQHTDTYNATINVTKQDGNGAALAGAGFVLRNSEGNYYSKNSNNEISWVKDVSDATEYQSNARGTGIVFDGLSDDTYILIENTVPDGYNKAEDKTITINGADQSDAFTQDNLVRDVTVVNNAGSLLPSTGGRGTALFYGLGFALVAGAAVLLVFRKKRA